ncbi:hypothetical protein Bca52824_025171 [Brassica carinata]|uniref:S-protein homolog n=1 Tax=Brassica carinata TaxID=52824 RepID=A0A8X8AUL4_BRACI|nr:hypothetical protein Bca52824_025171 [Brassica carinata]
MNKFIVFLFAISICFVSSEACAESRIDIKNELGKGVVLEIGCRSVTPTKNMGRVSIQFNDKMGYGVVALHERGTRTIITCNIWHAIPKSPKNPRGGMIMVNKLEAFAAGANRKCGQYREWVARPDGIYFRRNVKDPYERRKDYFWNTLLF